MKGFRTMRLQRQLQALRFSVRHLGLLGWLGSALILGAVVYTVLAIPQRKAELADLQEQIDRLQAERISLAGTGAEAGSQKSDAVDMPALTATPKVILALEDIARKDGLDIKRNDYRYVDPAVTSAQKGRLATGDQLLEVHITTPASGNYLNLRAFLSHALEQLPTLALDDLSLKRESIGTTNVQAQLRFTLFVRSEP